MKIEIIEIEGMHCSSCAILIDGDLEDLEGVKEARTNFAKGHTEIEYDENLVTIEKFIEVIERNGYKVLLI